MFEEEIRVLQEAAKETDKALTVERSRSDKFEKETQRERIDRESVESQFRATLSRIGGLLGSVVGESSNAAACTDETNILRRIERLGHSLSELRARLN